MEHNDLRKFSALSILLCEAQHSHWQGPVTVNRCAKPNFASLLPLEV